MAEYHYQAGVIIAGRYEIKRVLGRGGMAEVYLARDTALHRDIALKFLRLNPTLDEKHRQLQKDRLFREARSAAQLNHPGIVVIHDLGETDGIPYISMEYIQGKNLREILQSAANRGQTLPVRDILSIACQVAEALDYAHEHGVVHRDIKPENIMITPDEKCKITDFGIARSRAPGLGTLTTHGKLICTWHYTAPEYFKGGEADARGDQFSFGCVLYELLTGQFAFSGEGEHQVWYKITHVTPPVPGDIQFDIPETVNPIILKMLARSPAQRYDSCRRAATALETAFTEFDQGQAFQINPPSVYSDDDTIPAPTGVLPDKNQTPPAQPVPPGKTGTATEVIDWQHTRRIKSRGKRWQFIAGGAIVGIVLGLFIMFGGFGKGTGSPGKGTDTPVSDPINTTVKAPTAKQKPMATDSAPETPEPTLTPTVTPALTPTPIPTDTPVPRHVPTLSLQATAPAEATGTPTPVPTATKPPVPVPTATSTPVPIPTETPTSMPSATPSMIPTAVPETTPDPVWIPF